ncbi:MAG: serpin family protein [Lentisphaeria bacterium]|nr:serpin family protein [Lentisphaeria bacterium]
MKPTVSSLIPQKIRRGAAAALSAAALLSALSLAAPVRADEAADRKIVADLNRKGFDLLQLAAEKDAKENAFLSPYSIDSAFGLVYCGAKEKTAQEIRDTLGLPADPEECGRFFHAVSQDYAARDKAEVLVSNSVWYEQKYDDLILPSFLAMIDKYYGGTFYKEDFTKREALVGKVNSYVEDHTKNMIKDLLSPSDISDKTFMILLNTLYFEAKWKTPFKKEDTKPMIFRNFGGQEKRVKMMYRRGYDIGYYSSEEDNVHAVVLPYEDTRFDLIALMPINAGADQGEAAMKNIVAKIGDKLDTWLKNRSPYETRLWLPIADLTCRYSLQDALEELGMPTPFSIEKANFRGIAEPSPDQEQRLKYIWIEKVIHKTALKMDEVSTKAAAATAIIMGGMGGGIGQPPPVNIFRADRPYLVLIRDNQTGLILFAGRINDPGVEATEADGPVTPSFEGMPFGMPFGFGTLPPSSGPGADRPGTTAPGSRPGTRPGTQPLSQQTFTRPGAATLKGESPTARVDGQISVILEAAIDGEDAFVFRDGKVTLEHKTFKVPADVFVNGKPWEDLSKPFELGFTPDPASTKFACEGRGQKILTRTDDSVTVTIYDSPNAAARYRIILFQPSGVKDPLEQPTKPVDQSVMEIPTAATRTARPRSTVQTTGTDPATKPEAQQAAQPAEPGTLVLEGTFEGRGSFHFIDGLVVYSHKEGAKPTGVKINGESWTDLKKPVKLDAPFPVRIIRKQARGTVTLLPAEDFARLEIDDHQDGSASYRIELGTK